MKFTTKALALSFWVFVLSLSVQSFADDKKDLKDVAKDVKFACWQHGPGDMQLTLTLEQGTPRKIEIIGTGNSATKWTVKIDGKDETPANKGTVKIRPGDSITWKVEGGTHGVVFAEQDLAQAMLEFDMKAGKLLEDQNAKRNTASWKLFGGKRWGTVAFEFEKDVIVLAVAKVKT